jgi:hypothetical protein
MITSELPKYRTSKIVHALKIAEIAPDPDGGATIKPSESGYAPFKVDVAYLNKHKPQVGGYYIVYKDGYLSWSPADVFEESATPI